MGAGNWVFAPLSSVNPFDAACCAAVNPPHTRGQSHITDISKHTLTAGEYDLMATAPDVALLRRSWNANVVFDKDYAKTAHM